MEKNYKFISNQWKKIINFSQIGFRTPIREIWIGSNPNPRNSDQPNPNYTDFRIRFLLMKFRFIRIGSRFVPYIDKPSQNTCFTRRLLIVKLLETTLKLQNQIHH